MTSSKKILNISLVIVTVSVLVLLFTNQKKSGVDYRVIENWEEIIATEIKLETVNKLVLVEFFDYECPYCKRLNANLQLIKEKYPEKIKIVYKHYPLSSHREAFQAAIAAECARSRNRFLEYHNLLFEKQDQLKTTSYVELAKRSGIANDTFKVCLEERKTSTKILKDIKLGKKLKVDAIPVLMIEEKLITGVLTVRKLETLIKNTINQGK